MKNQLIICFYGADFLDVFGHFIHQLLGISTVNLAYMWEHAIQFGESNCFKKEIFMDFNFDSLVRRNAMQGFFME